MPKATTWAALGALALGGYALSKRAASASGSTIPNASGPKGTGPGTTSTTQAFVVGDAITTGGTDDFFAGLGYALFNFPTIGGGINRIGGTGRGTLTNIPSAQLATYYQNYREAFYYQVWLPASRVSVSDLTQADLTAAMQFLSQAMTIDKTCPLTYGQSTELNNANNTDGWVAELTSIVGPIANIFSFGLATVVQNDVVTPAVEKGSGVASHVGDSPAQGIAKLQAKMASDILALPAASSSANLKVLAPTFLACEDSQEEIGAILSAVGQSNNAAKAQSDSSSLAAQQQAGLASSLAPGSALLTPAQESTAWNAWGSSTLPYDDTACGDSAASQPSLGLDPMPISPDKSVYIRNRLFLATVTEGWWFPWISRENGYGPDPTDKTAKPGIIYKHARLYRALDFLAALSAPQTLPIPGQSTSMYGYTIGAYVLQGAALPPGPNDFISAWLAGGDGGIASLAVIQHADATNLSTAVNVPAPTAPGIVANAERESAAAVVGSAKTQISLPATLVSVHEKGAVL